MRILFFNPEQYVDFADEPSNVQLRLPILHCGLPIEHRDVVYQRRLRAEGRAAMDREALAQAADFRPDLIVYSATWEHENLSPWTLRALRDGFAPVLTMLWDSWIEPTTAEAELLAASSILATADSLSTYLRCRATGEALTPSVKVVFAAGQVFTDLVRPSSEQLKRFDVTLLGSNEGRRADLTAFLAERLAAEGVVFNKAGGLVDSRKGHMRLTDQWVSWPEYVRVINASRLCLSSETDPSRQQIKGKIFDYMACGVACLSDANPQVRRFVPEAAMALFDGPEDCLKQILRLLRDDGARDALAAAGQNWLTAHFNYKRFWSQTATAAVSGGPLPTSPLLEAEYAAFLRGAGDSPRRLLTLHGRRAAAHFQTRGTRRLATAWLARRDGFHLVALENGWVVASNRMPLEYLATDGGAADGGAVWALGPGDAPTPLAPGWRDNPGDGCRGDPSDGWRLFVGADRREVDNALDLLNADQGFINRG
jgi:hypothetical protein